MEAVEDEPPERLAQDLWLEIGEREEAAALGKKSVGDERVDMRMEVCSVGEPMTSSG